MEIKKYQDEMRHEISMSQHVKPKQANVKWTGHYKLPFQVLKKIDSQH